MLKKLQKHLQDELERQVEVQVTRLLPRLVEDFVRSHIKSILEEVVKDLLKGQENSQSPKEVASPRQQDPPGLSGLPTSDRARPENVTPSALTLLAFLQKHQKKTRNEAAPSSSLVYRHLKVESLDLSRLYLELEDLGYIRRALTKVGRIIEIIKPLNNEDDYWPHHVD
jgi:hypothetical protein